MLRCEMPHSVVISLANHLYFDEAPIPGDREHVLKESIADTQVLPFAFNRECNLCGLCPTVVNCVQFNKPSYLVTDKGPTDKSGAAKDCACVVSEHQVACPAAEPHPPGRRIKTTEVAADVRPVTVLKPTDLHFQRMSFLPHSGPPRLVSEAWISTFRGGLEDADPLRRGLLTARPRHRRLPKETRQ